MVDAFFGDGLGHGFEAMLEPGLPLAVEDGDSAARGRAGVVSFAARAGDRALFERDLFCESIPVFEEFAAFEVGGSRAAFDRERGGNAHAKIDGGDLLDLALCAREKFDAD